MKRKNTISFVAASVSLMTFAVYLYSLSNDFVRWDDRDYILDNPYIRSMDSVFFRWAFFDFSLGNWHPLTWMSHALDYTLWGLDPLGHHLTNNILHAANTFIVVLLVARLIETVRGRQNLVGTRQPSRNQVVDTIHGSSTTGGPARGGRFTLIAAATTGLLFGLHPLHVESVAWVAERKDLLCALFYLLSVLAYVKYRLFTTNKTYIFSLGFFVLALLSKPMAVSLPLVLVILDWYPFEKIRSLSTLRDAFIQKIPFIVLSFISSVLTIMAQRSGGALHLMEYVPLPLRVLVAAKALVVYLGKMMLPLNLVPLYPYPKAVSLLSLEFFPTLAVVSCITIFCLYIARRHRVWPAIWAYYIITLLPVLGIVQVGEQSMADRYTYLPSCGPFLAAGLSVAWFSMKTDTLKRWNSGIRIVGAAAALLIVAILTHATVKQIGIWKNAFSLMDYIIQKENNARAYHNRGQLYEEMGLIDKALADYNKAITLNSHIYPYHSNRGVLLMKVGRINEALQDYSQAIAIDSSRFEAYHNRGVLYLKAGQNRLAAQDFKQACDLGSENSCKEFRRVLSRLRDQGK